MENLPAAKALLEERGYVVLRRKSHQRAETERAVLRNQVEWAERDAAHAQAWARDCLAQERRAGERCTYLYGLAASLGATEEQLEGR